MEFRVAAASRHSDFALLALRQFLAFPVRAQSSLQARCRSVGLAAGESEHRQFGFVHRNVRQYPLEDTSPRPAVEAPVQHGPMPESSVPISGVGSSIAQPARISTTYWDTTGLFCRQSYLNDTIQ